MGETGAAPPAAPVRAGGRPWLLLVDDDSDVRQIVLEALALEPIEVVAASNGAAALSVLAGRDPPALVLLDLVMTGMDGEAFSRAYHDTPAPHAPLVLFTATTPLHDDAALARLRVEEVLRKPFDVDELISVVRRYAGGSPISS